MSEAFANMSEPKSSGNDLNALRVLIVEDESMVTMFLQDVLGDMGCEVVSVASRFGDALDKARSRAFDIAILDVNLNGEETFPIAEVLSERGLAFVFATGYGAPNIAAAFQKAPVLQKPFQQQDLERALRRAMEVSAR